VRGIRDDITTSYPGDKGIGEAFGLGAKIDPKKTGALLQLAGQLAGSFASREWNARAVAAGVTQTRIDTMSALRASLSGADVSQQGLFATNVDGTVQKDALIKAVSGSTAYARKVAGAVLKGNATALASFVPARARAARRDKKGKAAGAGATATAPAVTKKAPQKKAAKGKLRARRAQVKARAKSLEVGPTTAVKGAKKTAPKKRAARKQAK
jgi:hypothetical protein